MLILLLASVISWFMIDRKRSSYKRYMRIADDFETSSGRAGK